MATHEGYLYKSNPAQSAWQRRYFVLDHHELLYFEDEGRVHYKGCIDLRGSGDGAPELLPNAPDGAKLPSKTDHELCVQSVPPASVCGIGATTMHLCGLQRLQQQTMLLLVGQLQSATALYL